MEKQTRNKRIEIALRVLLVVGILTTAVVAPNAVQLFKYFIPKNNRDKWKVKQSFVSLERNGYVKRKTVKGDDYYSLTPIGKKRAMQYELNVKKIVPTKKWDGQWYLVMFDVPEEKKQARRAVNLALKKLGCVQYQKSVFITPYPCKYEIDFVGEAFDIRKHIRIIAAREVEGVESIKKSFKL